MLSDVKELVGTKLRPYQFSVEKGKIREFALAIGDYNPIYYDEQTALEEGFKGVPIPLTFLQVIDRWGGYAFEENMKLLNINPLKVLHGQQEYEFLSEIYAGDVLSVNGEVVDVQVKNGSSGGMNLVTIQYRYVNQNDEVVAYSRNTLIERH